MTTTEIDEEQFGHRSRRGDWDPTDPTEYPPVFVWPPRPAAFAKWFLRDYVWGENLLWLGLAFMFWRFLTPSQTTLESFEIGWTAGLLVRNLVLVIVVYGALHLRLYVKKTQGELFKYRARWPQPENSAFLFNNQTKDNVFWSLVSGVPIWTAIECLMLWAHANGTVTPLSWNNNPVTIVLLLLAVPIFRDLHFYIGHRLLHVPVVYKYIHKLHHNNSNPGPWSGLSMHPVEHALYFSGVFVHFVVAAHPIHFIYQLIHAGLAPGPGHAGFNKIALGRAGNEVLVDIGGYNHYLHHKFFECNYADGPIPFDKWFGTFHDGTPEAAEVMRARFKARS